MTLFKLIIQSFRHYFKPNLWVALGIAVTTAVLTGALIVGDSVKYSLEQAACLRLGTISHSVTTGDRFFTTGLAEKLNQSDIPTSAALKLEAIASSKDGHLKLNKINVWGIDEQFSNLADPNSSPLGGGREGASEGAFISSNLALRLNLSLGDEIVLRIKKASLIPVNAPFISDENQSVTYRPSFKKYSMIRSLGN
jgi:putative ABC transport system permease protein